MRRFSVRPVNAVVRHVRATRFEIANVCTVTEDTCGFYEDIPACISPSATKTTDCSSSSDSLPTKAPSFESSHKFPGTIQYLP